MSVYDDLINQGRLLEAADRLYGSAKETQPDTRFIVRELAKLVRALSDRIEYAYPDRDESRAREQYFRGGS